MCFSAFYCTTSGALQARVLQRRPPPLRRRRRRRCVPLSRSPRPPAQPEPSRGPLVLPGSTPARVGAGGGLSQGHHPPPQGVRLLRHVSILLLPALEERVQDRGFATHNRPGTYKQTTLVSIYIPRYIGRYTYCVVNLYKSYFLTC